jgi:hypothetical protein
MNIKVNGRNISMTIASIIWLVCEECFKDPMKTCLGAQYRKEIINLMIRMHLRFNNDSTIFDLLDFTVWRPLLHLVVL